jgi:hypothetical protein
VGTALHLTVPYFVPYLHQKPSYLVVIERQIGRMGMENQYDSKSSHLVTKMRAATVNRRVASSNLARGAKFSFFLDYLQTAIFSLLYLNGLSP